MNSIAIKKIGVEQLVPLQEIGRKTFYDTFFESDSEESMKAYLDTSFQPKNSLPNSKIETQNFILQPKTKS